MLYVSEIVDSHGCKVDSSAILRGVSVTAYDTETYQRFCDFGGRDCIGYSDVFRVAVKNTWKTAKLHDYIISAETALSGGRLAIGSDFKSVIVRDEWIDVFGQTGSIVSRTSYDTGVVTRCTLYDLLISLCRQCAEYLMYKDVLLIDSGAVSLQTIIRFRHSAEADRFFTKMYLEAGGVLCL